ncbi:MAG: tetratricopeptide repeat protein [Bacteroidetes bacterium]|nr:tetratricopeptide repeat protein [Bacteroidota bacterium]
MKQNNLFLQPSLRKWLLSFLWYVIFLHPFYIHPSLNAQTLSKVDSLEGLLKQEIDDTTKINILNDLAWNYRKKDYQKSLDYAEQALRMSNKANYQYGEAQSLVCIGVINDYNGKYKETQDLLNAALKIQNERHDSFEIARIWLLLGNVQKKQGKYEDAVYSYYQGLSISESGNLGDFTASFYNGLAGVKKNQGIRDEAKSYYQQALEIKKREKSPPHRLAVSYYNYAIFLAGGKEFDEALPLLENAGRILDSVGNIRGYAKVLDSRGSIFLETNRLKEALNSYESSIALKEKLEDWEGVAVSHLHLGDHAKKLKKYTLSLEYYNSCLKTSSDYGYLEYVAKAYEGLYSVYSQINKHDLALENYKNYITFRDSLFDEKTNTAIAEIETKYETEKKEREILALERENDKKALALQRTKNITFSIIGLLVLIATVIGFSYRNAKQKRKAAQLLREKDKQLHESELEGMKQKSELRAMNATLDGQEQERKRIAEALHSSMGSLLSALKLHFSSLVEKTNLANSSEKQLLHKTFELVDEAADTNRKIAHRILPPVLMRFGLTVALEDQIEKLSSPGIKAGINVFGLENRLPENLELMLYRSIDELLNNILKHAHATEITLQITELEDQLNIIVEDNGRGFDYDPANPNYGMGLNNIQARVKHLGGSFEIDSSAGNGTSVILNIPLNTDISSSSNVSDS